MLVRLRRQGACINGKYWRGAAGRSAMILLALFAWRQCLFAQTGLRFVPVTPCRVVDILTATPP